MSLLKSALTVSGLTLVSRVTGVIRDMLIARFFGASAETDAFYVAFRLPNMLRRLFAEGAFQQAFVPMLADVKERSEGEAGTFIDHVFTVLALSVFAASILGVVAAPLLVWAIASGLASAPEASTSRARSPASCSPTSPSWRSRRLPLPSSTPGSALRCRR